MFILVVINFVVMVYMGDVSSWFSSLHHNIRFALWAINFLGWIFVLYSVRKTFDLAGKEK